MTHDIVPDDILEWMERGDWEFPRSLSEFYDEHGYLTDAQLEAAEKCLRRQGKYATNLDLSSIPAGIYGDLTIEKPDSGKWEGWIFVKKRTGGKIGSQKPGNLYRGKSEDVLRELLERHVPEDDDNDLPF